MSESEYKRFQKMVVCAKNSNKISQYPIPAKTECCTNGKS